MALSVRVERFGRESAVALRDEVAQAQADDPLAPVTVVVARSTIGLATRRLLASGDLGPGPDGRSGVANVRFHTLGRLADQLGGSALAQARRLPATNAVVHAAIRAALSDGDAGLLAPVRAHPATERAMAALVRDLRDVSPGARARLAAGGERAAQVTALATDVQRRLAGWYDEHDLIDAALEVIAAEPARVSELGPVIVYLPGPLSPIEQRFLVALGAATAVVVVLGATGEPTADESTRLLAERLAPGGSTPFPTGDVDSASEVVNAPSADAEVLVVVRDLMARHRQGVPLERMAIVHGGADPYPRLVHEALEQAAIPNNGAGVRPLSATMVGRTLLGALALPDHGWRREDVLAWVSGAPIRSAGAPVPATAWDLISRQAGVTAGLGTWATHLEVYATGLETKLVSYDSTGDDDVPEWRRRRVERDLERARALAEFVARLATALAPESAPTSWTGWARWADRFLREHLGDHHDWRADEEQALIEIQNVLNGLAALDDLDPHPDPPTFRRALVAELDSPAPRTSRFGEGVLVGRIDAVVGLDLDVVYVVGMIEGVFPARPRDDALLPDAERAAAGDELPLRGARAADALRIYLAALASAPHRVLSFARGDQRRGRDQRPSPWLLTSLAAIEGRGHRLFSRDLPTLGAVPGYRLVPSLTAAIRTEGEPASLADRDLRSLLVWGEQFGRLDGHILVDLDPVLGLGLTARRQRASRGFSRFDGRVAGASVPSPTEASALSATSLQDYGTCPRRYLLGKVLRVSAPERPEDIQRISARDRGSLVHEVLERFIGAQVDRPRPERIRPDRRWSADDALALDAMAEAVFTDYEQRGLTGRTLLWELDQASIRRDLHAFLLADDVFRARAGVVPENVELAFGPGDGQPVTIDLAGGRRLTFKGFADRVDLADDGAAVVLDYKTGSARPYEDLTEADPVARGTKLQLPIYGLAARSRFGDVPVRSQYWFISEKGAFRTVGYDLTDDVVAQLHDTLEVMVDGIEGGIFPGRPGKSDRGSFENCRYCDFDAVCPSQRDREWERVRHAPELAPYVTLSEGGDVTPPVDDDTPARQEIRHHLDATLFVEAGAGTGKTTALVGRIVELVANDRARLRAIAAITFTEAAAGELRDRAREALERLAAGEHDEEYTPAGLDDPGRAQREARAAEALTEVDAAAITTLHGFAQRILAEHPFEAGLPPTFDVYDEIRSSVAFDERWSDFLDRLLDDPAHTHALQRALVTGITLDQLRSVALEFNRNWDLVADAVLEAPAPTAVDPAPVLAALDEATRAGGWCIDPTDKLLVHLEALDGFRSRLRAVAGDLETLQLLAQAPRLSSSIGRKDSWQGHVEEVRDLLTTAEDARKGLVAAVSQQALAHLLLAVRDLTLSTADQRRREGTLEFHDLLVQARDLLRHHADVATTLHQTYSHLLIDEFQDTDPIQAELAVRIATDDPDAATKVWTDLAIPPGSLFFVGDAKQAIYRFRRADIGLFLDVRATVVDQPLALTRNRRSVPGIIDWVNAMFAGLIGDGVAGVQPAYEPLVAHRPPHPAPLGMPSSPPVVVLGRSVEDQNIPAIRSTEAADIAGAVARIRDEAWPVGDEGRPARLADICVLIPTRTSLPALEDALESAGLPYRVESSSLVYASPEVRDLLTVLRAIDDPTDEVAIVAALRSPMFGCGDDDLVAHRGANGSWDYRKPPPEDADPAGPVAAGMRSLLRLHDERWWHDVSGLIQRVLAERRLLELALDDRRPRDVWRRLHFVTDQARVFTDAYGTDLRRYLAWAEVQCAEDARVVEAILPESDDDAVRIMTVHASKGLEFPIVVLSGLNVGDRSRRAGVDVLWRDTTPEVRLSKQSSTPGYEQLATVEDTMESYEQLRLLYVAATRARDHLLVSLHHKAGTACHASRLVPQCEAVPELWRRLDDATPAAVSTDAVPTTAGDEAWSPTLDLVFADDLFHDSVDARQRWVDQRAELVGRAARPRTLAATAVAKIARDAAGATGEGEAIGAEPPDESEPDLDLSPWRRGRAGTAIGRAVHAVLQLVDLGAPEGLAELARVQAVAEGVAGHDQEIERLVRVALDAPVVRAAVSSGRYWRELYVGTPIGHRTLEGFIDLLVEAPDGLVVVDYKTDAATTDAEIDAAVAHYRLQAASYAVAVEGVLGRPVTRAVFLFLRAHDRVEREVGDLDAAKAEVEAVLTAR